jgi:hypothetical protein
MIAFEDRAVAFIDVEGFSSLVNRAPTDASALSELNDLVLLLSSVIKVLDAGVAKSIPPGLIPKHLYISDCIILSAPLKVIFDEWQNYSGLEILVMRAIQVTHALLNAGYLVTGGIAIGPVWHDESNIVGPAYQDAYRFQQKLSDPYIDLSPEAKELWLGGGACSTDRMCIEYRGTFMVNGLHPYYVPDQYSQNIERAYGRYEAVAHELISSGLPEKAEKKWKWMQQYIADERGAAFPTVRPGAK